MQLYLYQRDECHLCDQALLVLARAGIAEFESVYIDGDAALEARYGTRVPVLARIDTEAELGWPFDTDQVRAWLLPRVGPMEALPPA